MKTIDVTPKWEGMMRVMLAVLENPKASAESKRALREELIDLGRWVDGVNLSGVDLSERPLSFFSAVNLTGCPSELYEGYVCTGGAILGPQV